MSEIIQFQPRTQTSAQGRRVPPASTGTRVFVRQAHASTWIVHDEHDRKGGCFHSHATAFRFAEEEFGANAEIVVQPLFPAANTISHIHQATSVAHRAVAAR